MDNYIMSEKAADARIEELEKENKELKNELMEDMKYEEKLEKENKELKKKLNLLTNQK